MFGAVVLTELEGSTPRRTRLPSRAATLLLARLALRPEHDHPREELIELIWPGVAADVGRNRLRQTLAVLRALLEPPGTPAGAVLLADRRALRLATGALGTDAGTPEGELLPGFFDEWVLEERARFAAHAEAQPPRQAARNAPPAEPPGPATELRVPQYLTRLVGFEAESAQLATLLREHRLVALRGPGGAGKTRLAVEVARSLAEPRWAPGNSALPDLVCFVPLASCTQPDAMRLAVLRALQHEPSAASGPADPLLQALAGRAVLLVLDNFEQLTDAASSEIGRWLARLPQLRLLVTTRRSLPLDGVAELQLAGLPPPVPGAPETALNPGVALFVDRARAARADFRFEPQHHTLVAELVAALHGLPLAVELAAARLRSLSLVDLHGLLIGAPNARRGGGLLLLARSGTRSPDDERHASMQQVLAWSWQQLGAADQDLLALLSVCDGGAGLALAAQLLGTGSTEAALAVDTLVAASVAYRREADAGSSRFHSFEPMREYLFATLGPERLAALRSRHLHAVAAWAAEQGAQAELLPAVVAAEQGNLLAALQHAAAEPSAVAAAAAINTVLALQSALHDVRLTPGAVAALRQVTQALPQHRHGPVQALLATQSFAAGEREAAAAHARAAQQATREPPLAGTAEAATALNQAARVLMRLGEPLDTVQALLDEALALARQHANHDAEAEAMAVYAVVGFRREGAPANERWHRGALELRRRHGPATQLAGALANQALALGFLHRVDEELVLLEQARTLAAQHGQVRLLAFLHSVTGYALADKKRWDESARMYRRCLQSAWSRADWREWFYALWNLPRTLARLHRPESAARLMGFAEAFYAERFGQLGAEDQPEARRTRRLVSAQLGANATAAAWQAGPQMAMAEAMQLALAETLFTDRPPGRG
jgi:predicted ATPase